MPRKRNAFLDVWLPHRSARGGLTVFVKVSFPRSLTALQTRVLKQVGLRHEELQFIFLLQALYAYQYPRPRRNLLARNPSSAVATSTEYPRRGRGAAATRPRKTSTE